MEMVEKIKFQTLFYDGLCEIENKQHFNDSICIRFSILIFCVLFKDLEILQTFFVFYSFCIKNEMEYIF